MRVLAIGDIHGCSRALDTLLAVVKPQPDDRLVTLGDYVDRGPDSRGVLDRLVQMVQTRPLTALRGNHDQMMMEAREGGEKEDEWLRCGGKETLASYGTRFRRGKLSDVPLEHWQFFEGTCVEWYETETHFFVHANAYPDLALDEQPEYMLLWEKLLPTSRPHESGKIMVCGHTAQKSGAPLDLGHAICIDTCVYGTGWLTCLDVASRRIWQANQMGEHRTAYLDDVATKPED